MLSARCDSLPLLLSRTTNGPSRQTKESKGRSNTRLGLTHAKECQPSISIQKILLLHIPNARQININSTWVSSQNIAARLAPTHSNKCHIMPNLIATNQPTSNASSVFKCHSHQPKCAHAITTYRILTPSCPSVLAWAHRACSTDCFCVFKSSLRSNE